MTSKIDLLLSLSEEERAELLSTFTRKQRIALSYAWKLWARPNQLPPEGNWRTWLVKAGRGFGKTRTGAEFIRAEIEAGRSRRAALVARTPADARDVMIEGESGILAVCPPDFKPHYEPSKRRLTWPNGAIATVYSSWDPDQLRGPQHDLYWGDELASWKYPETWDMLMFGLRLGANPRGIVTTTPRPIKLIKALMADKTTHVTNGSTYDNIANLASAFVDVIIKKYEGTRLGRQELKGDILLDVFGALWIYEGLDNARCEFSKAPGMSKVVVAIDPPASEDGAECGISVSGKGEDGIGYVIDDLSRKASPGLWAKVAVEAYHFYKANFIVAEANQGGQMVEHTIHTEDPTVPVRLVHATRGKHTRAEPIASLYEKKRVKHIGSFSQLEEQMCTWVPGEKSPDRMDALVWGLTYVLLGSRSGGLAGPRTPGASPGRKYDV